MRALLLFALFTLAGCQSFSDVDQKRPYSCNWRDAGVTECPSGWRCGYDNRCFDPKVPVGLKTCKFTQDCFDGFRCSSDNACFNPAIEEARVCRNTADCAPTWRCGITGVCQNRNDAGPYPCGVDDDCEQGWRCDVLAQVCANVTDTLFGEARPVGSTRLTPGFEGAVPLQIALSTPSDQVAGGLRLFVSVFDAGVRMVGIDRNENTVVFEGRLPLPVETIAEVVAVGDQAVFRTRTGDAYRLGLDGGLTLIGTNVDRLRQIDPNPLSGRLSFNAPALLAMSNGQFVVLNAELQNLFADAGFDAGLYPLPTQPVLLDVAGVENDVFALRDYGIFHEPSRRPIDNSCQLALFPAEVRTRLPDGGAQTCRGERNFGPLVHLDRGVQFRLLASRSGAQFGLSVVSIFPDGRVRASVGWANDNSARFNEPTIVCPGGLTPLQLSVSLADSTLLNPRAVLRSRCPALAFDGGSIPAASWEIRSDEDSAKFNILVDDQPQWEQGIRAQTTTSNDPVHAGRNGLVWFEETITPNTLTPGVIVTAPLLLDRVPGAIFRANAPGKAFLFALTDLYLYSANETVGLVQSGESLINDDGAEFVPAGPVLGQPNWEITRKGVIDLDHFLLGSDTPRFVVRLPASEAELSAPAFAQVETLSDGRRLLVVVSGDRLLSADVTAVEQNPYLPPERLEVRLIPSPGVRLRGLAIDGSTRQLPDAGITNLATGFLLTDSTLFAFQAVTQNRWGLTTVRLPERFGSPIQLWSEKGRARLAFDRGTVMTLPERVPIAGDLPRSDAGVVSDFARLCGTTYALRADGLYRSVLGDGGSRWQSLPLSPSQLPPEEREGGQLFETASSMFIATTHGRVIELFIGKTDAGMPTCD